MGCGVVTVAAAAVAAAEAGGEDFPRVELSSTDDSTIDNSATIINKYTNYCRQLMSLTILFRERRII